MEILKIVEKLEEYATKIFAVMVDDEFTKTMCEAAALLIGQGEKIADLENSLKDMEHDRDYYRDRANEFADRMVRIAMSDDREKHQKVFRIDYLNLQDEKTAIDIFIYQIKRICEKFGRK